MTSAQISLPQASYGFTKRNQVLLHANTEGELSLLLTTATTPNAFAELQRFYSHSINIGDIDIRLVDSKTFESYLEKAFQGGASETIAKVEDIEEQLDLSQLANAIPETEDLLESENDAPIIQLINALLTEAIKTNASDIHIETYERKLVVRFRIDGVLRPVVEPKRALAPLLISRIKVMSKLDIAEKRVPQDGRISLRVAGRDVDVRVSTLPSANGERVVMRILDKQAGRFNLPALGMRSDDENRLSSLLQKPHGIILVTGPTGSGKTTTLYAGLSHINAEERNILTIEDPIEYQLEGIGQTQVNTKADMTFARGLRAILRQDPDVVMIGEIRDKETAEIAVQASLTGHLVLSTLHTNSAIGAITRLEDMGVEPFLLASSMIGILAQRLVRVLCPACKKPACPDEAEKALLGERYRDVTTIYHAQGCEECNQLGYIGRTGIYELVTITDKLRTSIHNKDSEETLLKSARGHALSIRQDGLSRVAEGMTTLDEVVRVTQDD